MEKSNELICSELLDNFMRCTTPVHQLNSLRRYAEYDNCAIYLKDWGTCLYGRAQTNAEKKNEIMTSLKVKNKVKTITAGSIWEFKDHPNWTDKAK